MTSTRSKVTRVTVKEFAVLHTKAKRIVCTIGPGDTLEFREHGSRYRYSISFETGFRYSITLAAMKIGRRIAELRKEGKKLTEARRIAEREYFQ